MMSSWGRAAGASMVVWMILTTGCGHEEPIEAPRFTVRLLTSPNLSGRWERAAEQGLGLIAAELGADVGRNRVGEDGDSRKSLTVQGKSGVDLVFCVGGGFEKTLYAGAGAHPGTVFVLLPGRARSENVAGVEFLPEGTGYLAGVTAAALSSQRHVGLLRGSGGPWLEALETGFETGFRARRRRAVVKPMQGVEGVWGLNVTDIGIALYAVDEPDSEVLLAARESGLRLIVTDTGLLDEFPDVVVAAVQVDVAGAMMRVAREVRDGNFTGRVYSFDLGSGILDLRINDGLDPEALAAASEALEVARAEVTAGLVEFDHLGL